MTEAKPTFSNVQQRAIALLRHPGTWATLLAAAVILPFLGSSGLWDPWETHYAEVARRMVTDGDWITPRWQHELFFSKPILNFWLMAISFKLFGISAFAARLPFALVGIFGVWFCFRFISRILDNRRGFWCALVLATSPFYFFISRQAITDITFCVFVLGSLGSFIVVALEDRPRLRDVLAIYIFAGLAALAKTPVGLAIPGAVVLAYLLLTGDWFVLKKIKLHIGIPLFLVVAAPWYLAVQLLHGRKFSDEFFMHHNIQRAFTGVHGERGTFEYFIKQMGYGFFPWLALLPLALGRAFAGLRLREALSKPAAGNLSRDQAGPRLELFVLLWFAVTFVTFTLFVTKFHHYVFPALPPLAMLIGLAVASEEGGNWKLLGPLGVLALAIVANDIISSDSHLANLYTYAYERPLPDEAYPRFLLLFVSLVLGVLLLLNRWFSQKRVLVWLLASVCGLCAFVMAWDYQPKLGHTMSQQDLFETYQRLAKPNEKIYQYQMNWRGEVFYSQDTITKIDNEQAAQELFKQPQRMFIVAVRDSLGVLDRAARQATGKHLVVLPGSGVRYLLGSNQLLPGEENKNILSDNVFSEAPPISHPIRAEFAEGVAFLGYDLKPESPDSGDEIELVLYFQCQKKIEKSWEVFIHIDGYGREFHRVNGDHFPMDGLYNTDQWLPGDIIRDRVKMKIPIEFSAARYTIYLGFYIGDIRMKVLPNFPQDGSDRVRAGTFVIE